jgi:hypothetical protein
MLKKSTKAWKKQKLLLWNHGTEPISMAIGYWIILPMVGVSITDIMM